ncbi:hypothetical protein GO304_01216 [Ralstonia solanacearum]|nr:hypothetical protein [Ralstonia solanacearum]NJZ76805.1 hypothetical protein [Ralstonia solanacearum]NJZ81227.1 hypothetical protein [Ralstonia solanacearum]NKA87671.1 hypothetical protein [Ralstonia solanacearum]NKF78391.1 hypothetical protein [Ralstonia solanacearum]
MRGERPKPDRLRVELTQTEDGYVSWEIEEGHKAPAYVMIAKAIHDKKPLSQSTLAYQLGVSKQHVSKQIKLAMEKGLIAPGKLELTAKGVELVAQLSSSSGHEDSL